MNLSRIAVLAAIAQCVICLPITAKTGDPAGRPYKVPATMGDSTGRPNKIPLSHDVYDGWTRVAGESIAPDGAWILYTLEPQEGDARLILYHVATGATDTIARGSGAKFTENSDYAVFAIKAFFAEVRKAKIAKKKPDDMPKDSLGILRLGSHDVVRIPRVKSFKLPEHGSGWVAYQLEKEIPSADTTKKAKGKSKGGDAPDDQGGDKKEEKGTTVVFRELGSGKEFRFPFARDYALSRDGTRLLVTATGNDSTEKAGVFAFSTATRSVDTLALGRGTFKLPVWDHAGRQAAFVADRDTSKAKQRYFGLWYWTAGRDTARLLVDTLTHGMIRRWLVSDNGPVKFSKDGSNLYLGTAPVPMPEDTTMNDEVTARLDVWSWKDRLIQPQQLKLLDQEKKRTYTAVLHLADRSFVQLGDTSLPSIETGGEGNGAIALGSSSLAYQRQQTWEGTSHDDVYSVDVRTGTRRQLLSGIREGVDISPGGRYITWFDWAGRHWYAMPLAGGAAVKLTASVHVPLADEENDVPDDPSPYGTLGWVGQDSLLLIYDRFDIWVTDPTGRSAAWCLTRGEGRKSHCRFRYIKLDPEERFLAPGGTMYLEAFDETTKMDGYAVTTTDGRTAPRMLLLAPNEYSTPLRAKHAGRFIFTRGNFRECPDLFVADTTMSSVSRISNANPRMGDYLWGSAELVRWKSVDRKPLEGLLYMPEGFDAKKKYPMVVYYYERNSDLLYHWYTPAPSASTVNIPLYVSRGYLVFVPDIRYRVGHPGQSAYDCIVPGVKALIARGFVNKERIGLQGQSWGGYQTAFLVTRTNMFRAAEAGAPVSNMTSAYGGIRWGTGLARLFQYEHSQSRIGGTLWERPGLFIENSPLFRADSVRTPLLIMHNDADGAVPWWQGIELFNALRRLDRPVWMLTYNNEDHNLVQRRNRKDLSIRMLQFFDHYLMDKPAPKWMTEGLPAVIKGKTLRYELDESSHGSD